MNSVFIPYSNIFILAIPLFPSAILSANHPWMNSKHTALPTSVTPWMSCGCTIHYPVCTRPLPKSFACVCLCVWVCVCECAVVSLKPPNFSYTQQLKTKHWRYFAQHLHQIIEDSLGPLMHAWSFHSLHCELKFPSIHTICNKKEACAGKLWCFDLILILALFLFNTFKR